jgi:uncharacterized protein YggT (Ycf19 family)
MGRLAIKKAPSVDFSYLALVIVLYALTSALIWAIGRLRGQE